MPKVHLSTLFSNVLCVLLAKRLAHIAYAKTVSRLNNETCAHRALERDQLERRALSLSSIVYRVVGRTRVRLLLKVHIVQLETVNLSILIEKFVINVSHCQHAHGGRKHVVPYRYVAW